MKQIGLALHNYYETHDSLPPGATLGKNQTPYHSWQAMILPFLDQLYLYRQIHFNEPWDASVNQEVFKQKIPEYLNPKTKAKISPEGYSLSHYVGNELVLKPNIRMKFEEIQDGSSNTILAIETGENFKPWGDPTALTKPVNIISPKKKSPSTGGYYILLCDGRVHYVSEDIDPSILKALSTPDGGEEVGEY
ncbi:DUF1559 family PulG-like putative transporter [Gimesia aquarii]|uniref:DUF1559 domain-containing protein n=1 Tax=Gimesia aquarii TaxID=2527964 RepID=A0A517VVL6_9PLAN|nr:DUF1559 domain-containing protein [Gimesia aquarii]QDT97052.1 hypothetical protein V144x_25230 [Gimesia aquarii]